ncbi:glycosyltransferase family 39 protein [Phototrophicus methaneseepsis]|uniref:Glycosyltransferase family 39 protein n=1 Tax=Phototrophicus methaneseepsis TaxID=2710758 RepID=A0A7S8E8A6_9CHLR|nr:glycosyltransferase family 39 protein [Phototrophicus methaneseepsis]QPC82189.1 glycosyltransferase family 39 protein [Phototrophicus methaneseepsis]
MTKMTKYWQSAIAVALVFLSFGLSAFFSRVSLERLPHLEDELAYLYQARVFAGGQLTIDTPVPYRAYWQPFVIDYAPTGQRASKYPPGWSMILAFGVAAGQAWVVNALLSSLLTALTYAIGRRWFNADAGLIAALLVAFSPMVLLLGSSLMGHTIALCCVMGILLVWRGVLQGRIRLAIIAGALLGLLYITRPLPAVGIGLVCVVMSLAVLWRALRQKMLWRRIQPFLWLSAAALLVMSIGWIYNAALTGDPFKNLYVLVWDYDRPGFGACCGRSGHNLGRAINHARFDLSLAAADLFGWQIGSVDGNVVRYWLEGASYYPNLGLSLLLLIPGVLMAVWPLVRRHPRYTVLWVLGLAAWLLPIFAMPDLSRTVWFSWAWVISGVGWFLWPLLILRGRLRWPWVLISLTACLLLLSMIYWTGSQRYSTRYFFEMVGAVSLLSALPLAWLAAQGRWLQRVTYGLLIILTAMAFVTYTIPRIQVLHGFNQVTQATIDEVLARRVGDAPLIVIVNGPSTPGGAVSWRAYGMLMAVTSPYLDSDIVVARDNGLDGVRDAIYANSGGRQIIEMQADGSALWFLDEQP